MLGVFFVQTEVIVASSEVDDVAASNQVDCTIDMLIAAASQQSTVSIVIMGNHSYHVRDSTIFFINYL